MAAALRSTGTTTRSTLIRILAALAAAVLALGALALSRAGAARAAVTMRRPSDRLAVRTLARPARLRWYAVRPGDTLSAIAARYLGASFRWGGLYRANRQAVGWDPDRLRPGTVLRLANTGVTANFARHIRNATRPVVRVRQVAASAPSPAQQPAPVSSPVTYSGTSGFEACVIAAESGGNPTAVNPSTGAAGLYGFLPSTWAALGFSGLPQDASPAVQREAFLREYAQSGTSPWAPYDGC